MPILPSMTDQLRPLVPSATARFDPERLAARLAAPGRVVLELGCGPDPRPEVIGVDVVALPGVEVVADLEAGLPFLPDASVDEVYSRHVLEHVANLPTLLRDIHRVLRPGGRHVCIVPHFSNPYYYSDPTHQRFFGLYTFDYFAPPGATGMRRTVPGFYFDFHFRVVSRELRFRSMWKLHGALGKQVGRLVNRSAAAQEFYERHLCWRFPCQEIRFEMEPVRPEAAR